MQFFQWRLDNKNVTGSNPGLAPFHHEFELYTVAVLETKKSTNIHFVMFATDFVVNETIYDSAVFFSVSNGVGFLQKSRKLVHIYVWAQSETHLTKLLETGRRHVLYV